jgi:CRP-like cAMP-binding protein
MATIYPSENWLLRIGSSLEKEPFFQKLMGRRNGPGQVHARLRLMARVEREHGALEPRIRLLQSHLASMIGVSRLTLNAAPARLQRRGLVRVGFRMIALVA